MTRKILGEGKFTRLVAETLSNGVIWEYVERPHGNLVVFIIPVTDAGEIVLVEQYRASNASIVVELPAGMIDPGEDPAVAAARELAEETGYTAARLTPVIRGPLSPGMSAEVGQFYLATGLTKTARGGGLAEEGEDIAVHVIALDAVESWLAAQGETGKMVEPRIYAGLLFARRAHAARSGQSL